MLLSQLLLPGSCATLLLMGCSAEPASRDQSTLSPDTALAALVAQVERNSAMSLRQPDEPSLEEPSASGSNPPIPRNELLAVVLASNDSQPRPKRPAQAPVQQPNTTDILIGATAPVNSSESLSVFTPAQEQQQEPDSGAAGLPKANRHRGVSPLAYGMGGAATIGAGSYFAGLFGGSHKHNGGGSNTGPDIGFGNNEGNHPNGGQANPFNPGGQGNDNGQGNGNGQGGSGNDGDHDQDGHNDGGDGPWGPPGDNPNSPPPVVSTPEPATIALLATGLVALIPVIRRRRRS